MAAIASARGPDRTRVLWASAAVIPVLLFDVIATVAGNSMPAIVRDTVFSLTWFATPAILTYSLLNRRLLDLGFIVNRAAVFTAVSGLLLGVFVLVEWLLTDWMRDASHVTNILVTGALAVALGLSIRIVHGRIDRMVDSVFFRKRHEDEQAIRAFADDAPFITDPSTLLQRAQAVLNRHTNAAYVLVLLDDGKGRYGTVPENDPALVRLRATRFCSWSATLRRGFRARRAGGDRATLA